MVPIQIPLSKYRDDLITECEQMLMQGETDLDKIQDTLTLAIPTCYRSNFSRLLKLMCTQAINLGSIKKTMEYLSTIEINTHEKEKDQIRFKKESSGSVT